MVVVVVCFVGLVLLVVRLLCCPLCLLVLLVVRFVGFVWFCWYSICWLVLGRCELEAGPVCVAAPWAAPNCWVSPMIFMVGARQKRPGCLSKLGVVSMLVSPRGGGVVLAAERLTPSSRAALMRAVQGSDAHTVA